MQRLNQTCKKSQSTPTTELPKLPYNSVAERAILGAILLETSSNERVEEAFQSLECNDFFLPQHQVIFRHMSRLREQRKPTNDTVVLCESLVATQELEAAGGIGYVISVPDGLPRVTNLSYYVEIVKLKSLLRRKAYIAEMILTKLLSANGDASEVLQEVSTLSAPLREEVGQK